MIERRRYERTSATVRVEMSHPGFGTIVGFTKDISDGGALVQIDNQPTPPVGTEVEVRFKKSSRSHQSGARENARNASLPQYYWFNVPQLAARHWLGLIKVVPSPAHSCSI